MCPQKLLDIDPFEYFLYWVDAHDMVGGRTVYGGWTHSLWWVDAHFFAHFYIILCNSVSESLVGYLH